MYQNWIKYNAETPPKYPQSFTGKERDSETGFSYFGARYYDSDLMTGWLSVDPMADKYPNLSPYAYCALNPIRLVDPDGKKIKYAHGTSEEFKKKFEVTIKYMNSKGTAGILAELEKRNEIIYISELDSDGPRFSPSKNTIFWDPHLGVLTDEGVVISPATVLNHEADHALQYLKNQQQMDKDLNTKDSHYENLEEKRVITGTEQITAKKHGEINEGEVTRENHDGTLYTTISPISTKSKYEPTIIENR